jgi:uncharacterized membrane-anchored protein YhcB (DUF1043 family)
VSQSYKVVKKLSKSCQKVVKKLSKSCQNVVPHKNYFGPNIGKKSDKQSKPKLENSENLQERFEERYKEKRKRLVMMNARHP